MENLPFDIASIHRAYAAGETPESVVRECFRRIAHVGDPGVFIHLIPMDDVLKDVGGLGPYDPQSKPLWGIPFVIKDNIDAAGRPTTAACPAFTYVADEDAFVLQQLRAAGAVLIGKTNLDQFATGLVGVRTPYPVPKNAIDPDIVPGGSSSGSAVAVSHGFVTFSLGTDTAGSGRVPAALNNIVGLKPTLGMLSNSGVVPACLTLDTISIFALCVDDAHTVFRAAAVFDPSDPYCRDITAAPKGGAPSALRIGIPTEESRLFFGDDIQAESYAASIARLKSDGAEITEIDFTPFYDVAKMLYDGVWVAERYTVIADLLRRSPDEVHPTTRQVVKAAEKFSAVDTFEAFYKLQHAKNDLSDVLLRLDLLCVPTVPRFPSVRELIHDPIAPNSELGTYTNFVNLLDLCGLAVPTGRRTDGRPEHVTLLATAGKDHLLASIGAVLHARANVTLGATAWPVPQAAPVKPSASPNEIEIAVVGAHMSGLPLNKDLTTRGARFLRATSTTNAYQLYSLPGGPPARPGLVKDEGGASIAIEIWAMPKKWFGDFMATIPKPLSIGTIDLDDGATVNGFLCEPYAVKDAEDITGYGGWRAFIEDTSNPSNQLMERTNAQT